MTTSLDFSEVQLKQEIDRITDFVRDQSGSSHPLVLGLSGGIDSDVCARLCARAVGANRLKCFTILQDDFDPKYVNNARQLTQDLGVNLVEIPLAEVPKQIIGTMADADPDVGFVPDPAFLDVGRSKCAIRTFVFSAYAERGYLIVGPSNRTELELGYFLPLGDALAHFRPIVHLYKTQVQQLARALGTRPEVISQQPAAGFWIGDEDLKGVAYWLYNEGPIQIDLNLDQDQKAKIREIRSELSFRAIDQALIGFNEGWPLDKIAEQTNLSRFVIERLQKLTKKALEYKRRELGVGLDGVK